MPAFVDAFLNEPQIIATFCMFLANIFILSQILINLYLKFLRSLIKLIEDLEKFRNMFKLLLENFIPQFCFEYKEFSILIKNLNLEIFQLIYQYFCEHFLNLYYNFNKQLMQKKQQTKLFYWIGLGFMSLGYFWLWYFNRNPHVLIKFLTMEAYFLVWLYFLLLTINKNSILGYNIERLFELNFVLQLFVTPIYWSLIHGSMIASKKFPRYEQNWNIYIHLVPIVLLILDFGINKRQFRNNWKDTLKFYYFFALPVNLLYSHLHKPVYHILLYDDFGDYISVFSCGLIIVLAHQLCFHFLKGWNSKKRSKGNANKMQEREIIQKQA